MAVDQRELRGIIKDCLRSCNLPLMDHTILVLVLELGSEVDDIEAIMHEEVVKLSHEHQMFWMGRCDCHVPVSGRRL